MIDADAGTHSAAASFSMVLKERAAAMAAPRAELRLQAVGRPLVMVVEDEVLIRMAVAAALRNVGLHALEARDADEALTVIHAGIIPDVLFTDVRMPGSMDGLKLAALLESMFPGMLVIVSSAYIGRNDLRMGVRFIAKPLEPAIIARTIKKLMAQRKPHNDDADER
jgi:CheY-like chemotaxis protein